MTNHHYDKAVIRAFLDKRGQGKPLSELVKALRVEFGMNVSIGAFYARKWMSYSL